MALVIDPQINLGIESNTGHQGGVRAFDLRKLQMGGVDVYRIKPDFLAKVQKERAISFLVDHLGAKYDLLGVIGLGLLKILSFMTLGLTKNGIIISRRRGIIFVRSYAMRHSIPADLISCLPYWRRMLPHPAI